MTLALSLQNDEYSVQISERRITLGRVLVNDDSEKAGFILTRDARFAFSYTGLAVTWFASEQWLQNTLLAAASPDYTYKGLINRFAELATVEFRANSAIKRLASAEKRFLVMFSGFVHAFSPARAFFAVAGNFLDGSNTSAVDDTFSVQYWIRSATSDGPLVSVQRIGNWPALSESLAVELEGFLRDRKPPDALIGKGLNILRQASASPRAANNIGRRATYIVIPADLGQEVRVGYDPDAESDDLYVPSVIVAFDDANRKILTNMKLTKVRNQDSRGTAFVKQVSRRAPCPCGSGQHYSHCHGKNKKW